MTLSNITGVAIGLTAFLSPFSVTVFPNIALMASAIISIILLFVLVITGSFRLYKQEKNILLLYFLPLALSAGIGLPVALASSSYLSFIANELFFAGRVFNLLIGFIYIIGSTSVLSSPKIPDLRSNAIHRFAYFYWLGTALIVFTGIWQALSIYLNWIPFPFSTRSHVHSVPLALRTIIPGRLTGIAREPSYFVPLVIDYLILNFLFFKRKSLYLHSLIGTVLLFLSFSPSAFLNIAFIVFCYYGARLLWDKSKLKIMAASFALLLFSVILLLGPLNSYFQLYWVRLLTGFSIETHSRMFMLTLPFFLIWDSGVLNILFGHGPKTYALIGNLVTMPNGSPVHVTSNNLFSDALWESGILGLASILTMLYVLLSGASQQFKSKEGKTSFILTCHLFMNGMYRADFATLRFFTLLVLILSLGQIQRFSHNRGY